MDFGPTIGIDSCSAVNVTTRREDPIFLNTSPDSLQGMALSGVGGSANLIGAFLWLVPLHEALIPQADGSYELWHDAWLATGNMQSSVLMKYTERQRHIRVLTTEMLKANGLVIRDGIGPDNKGYLLCKKSGVLIPMHSERGLQVTSHQDQEGLRQHGAKQRAHQGLGQGLEELAALGEQQCLRQREGSHRG
jgi:hypothetical protein